MGRNHISAAARVVSVALHPLAMPVYAVALLFFGHTVMRNLSMEMKYYFMAVIGLTTIVIPLVYLALAGGFRKEAGSRGERMRLALILLICYSACFYMIYDIALALLLRKFLLGAIGGLAFASAVSYFRPVSLHMVAAGVMTALITKIGLLGLGQIAWALYLCILLSGTLASSRLWLGREDQLQVYGGYLGGVIAAWIAMALI